MPGFFITNSVTSPKLRNYDDSRCFVGEIKYQNWIIKWNALNKFIDDKVFKEYDEYIIMLDGIILNKKELIKNYKSENWEKTLLLMVKEGPEFIAMLRGAFAGAVYYKKKNKWVIFTDQIGNHIVLYCIENNAIAIGTQLNYFSDWMSINNFPKRISPEWKDDMIGYGYMREVHTVIDGVNRVFPGCYLVIDEKNTQVYESQYYKIKKTENNYNENEIIEKLDSTFRKAILRIIEKCREYGYKCILDLSGGLDSRMIARIASSIDKDAIGINYAQIGSLDQTIAFDVANTLRMNCLIHPLNRGRSIEDIDDFVFMNQGLSFYAGITGGKLMLEVLDRDIFGIEIWGVLGDIYEGAMITDDDLSVLKWDYPRFRTSRLFDVKNKGGYSREYYDNELLWFYIRGMFAGESTGLVRQNFMEGITPYGDVEFMDLIFSISYNQRTEEHIYRKWMIEKYPEMAAIPYSHTQVRVTQTDKETDKLRIPVRLRNRFLRIINANKMESLSSMNPIDYWIRTEEDLKSTWDSYYRDNYTVVENDEELLKAVEMLYQSDKAMDKIVALTIISSIKQYIT